MNCSCSCGYNPAADGPVTWSAAWHRAHRDHHLAVWPESDAGTIRALEDVVERVAALEAVSGRPPRAP